MARTYCGGEDTPCSHFSKVRTGMPKCAAKSERFIFLLFLRDKILSMGNILPKQGMFVNSKKKNTEKQTKKNSGQKDCTAVFFIVRPVASGSRGNNPKDVLITVDTGQTRLTSKLLKQVRKQVMDQRIGTVIGITHNKISNNGNQSDDRDNGYDDFSILANDLFHGKISPFVVSGNPAYPPKTKTTRHMENRTG